MSRFACVILAVTAAALPALADETTKTAKIQEMLKLTNSREMMQTQLASMETMMSSQMRQMNVPLDDAKVVELMDQMKATWRQMLSWDRLEPVMIRIYSETFSDADLDGILQFYRSPAGQALIAKMPVLMNKTMESMQGLISDSIRDLKQKMDELSKKYPPGAGKAN